MNKQLILKYLNKYRFYIIGIITLIIIISIILFLNIDKNETKNEIDLEQNLSFEEKEIIEEKVTIDIKGAIKNPGVYKLDIDSTVIDAINISGGLNDDADTSTINLSKKLTDEMVIIIYTIDEIEEMRQGSTSVKYIENECICPKITNDACIEEKITNNDTVKNNDSKETSSIININTANLDELMSLNGIGESKAKAIIEYRNTNGNFKTTDEIINVKGIGSSVYEKIKNNITV